MKTSSQLHVHCAQIATNKVVFLRAKVALARSLELLEFTKHRDQFSAFPAAINHLSPYVWTKLERTMIRACRVFVRSYHYRRYKLVL